MSLSNDGNILAVGTGYEDSSAAGILSADGLITDDDAANSGVVYLFTHSGMTWSQ